MQKYYIKTFGCQANSADSERIAAMLANRGMKPAKTIDDANHVVINTCMIRKSAENRVYGLVNNLGKRQPKPKIVVTGCMIGMAARDKTGKFLKLLRKRMPYADELLPIEEVGFDHAPLRTHRAHAWVPISNGCNNFCTFCVVPFTRGREISRSFEDIVNECKKLKKEGYTHITLIGQNVNSYGSDLILDDANIQKLRDVDKTFFPKKNHPIIIQGKTIKPVLVKHLGKHRIPTLFPYLLEQVASLGFTHIDFMSSNPWDFSDELIDVIAHHSNITRTIHLPLQSGDTEMLKKMNRWYSRDEYIALIAKLKNKIENVTITTDIIVGFCGETKEQFSNTVDLCKRVGFFKVYVAMYSDRPMTAAHKAFKDDVPHVEKKRRWQILENLINQPNLDKFVRELNPKGLYVNYRVNL